MYACTYVRIGVVEFVCEPKTAEAQKPKTITKERYSQQNCAVFVAFHQSLPVACCHDVTTWIFRTSVVNSNCDDSNGADKLISFHFPASLFVVCHVMSVACHRSGARRRSVCLAVEQSGRD